MHDVDIIHVGIPFLRFSLANSSHFLQLLFHIIFFSFHSPHEYVARTYICLFSIIIIIIILLFTGWLNSFAFGGVPSSHGKTYAIERSDTQQSTNAIQL